MEIAHFRIFSQGNPLPIHFFLPLKIPYLFCANPLTATVGNPTKKIDFFVSFGPKMEWWYFWPLHVVGGDWCFLHQLRDLEYTRNPILFFHFCVKWVVFALRFGVKGLLNFHPKIWVPWGLRCSNSLQSGLIGSADPIFGYVCLSHQPKKRKGKQKNLKIFRRPP